MADSNSMTQASECVPTPKRIASLDVLRGFALLGILLLNILAFGMHSAVLLNPQVDLSIGWNVDFVTWFGVELLAEGAMRCLFSMLFGAGMLLFLDGSRARPGRLFFKRLGWLLVFGVVDAYVLLWNGDILVTYAIAGVLIYFFRKRSALTLFLCSVCLILLMSGFYGLLRFALEKAHQSAEIVAQDEGPDPVSATIQQEARLWTDFASDLEPSAAEMEEEFRLRRTSYFSAFAWNAKRSNEIILMVIPLFLLWDVLAMMLLGMALWRSGVLQGQKSRRFYLVLMVCGFVIGLGVNGLELVRAVEFELEIVKVFPFFQSTYQFGRLGMAMGYLGLLIVLVRSSVLCRVTGLLAYVGRMALTNYLMQSLICAIAFSGLGFGLVGYLDRSELYLVVLLLWSFQLWFSQFWLKRWKHGPFEWLWRRLTYGASFKTR